MRCNLGWRIQRSNISLSLESGSSALVAGDFNRDGTTDIARGAATGDFNRDGNLDNVRVDFASNSTSILLGLSDGTFSTGSMLTTGASPGSASTRDFNEDGTLDLVTSDNQSDILSVFLGRGDGTFNP